MNVNEVKKLLYIVLRAGPRSLYSGLAAKFPCTLLPVAGPGADPRHIAASLPIPSTKDNNHTSIYKFGGIIVCAKG